MCRSRLCVSSEHVRENVRDGDGSDGDCARRAGACLDVPRGSEDRCDRLCASSGPMSHLSSPLQKWADIGSVYRRCFPTSEHGDIGSGGDGDTAWAALAIHKLLTHASHGVRHGGLCVFLCGLLLLLLLVLVLVLVCCYCCCCCCSAVGVLWKQPGAPTRCIQQHCTHHWSCDTACWVVRAAQHAVHEETE